MKSGTFSFYNKSIGTLYRAIDSVRVFLSFTLRVGGKYIGFGLHPVLTTRCKYGHTYGKSMDQPGKVASPARGQLNRKNEYFPVRVRA